MKNNKKMTVKEQNAARQNAAIKEIDARHAACPSTIPRRAIRLLPPHAVCEAAAAHKYEEEIAAAAQLPDKAARRDAHTAAAVNYVDALADNDAYTGLRYDDTIISRVLVARAAITVNHTRTNAGAITTRVAAEYYAVSNLIMEIAAAVAASVMDTIYKGNKHNPNSGGDPAYRTKRYCDAAGVFYWTTATRNSDVFNSLTHAAAAALWECGSITAARKAANREQYMVYRKPFLQEEPAVITAMRQKRIKSDADKLKGNKGVRGTFKAAFACLDAAGVKNEYREVFARAAHGATTEDIAATVYGVTITAANHHKYTSRVYTAYRAVAKILARDANIHVKFTRRRGEIQKKDIKSARAFTAAIHAATPTERHRLISEHSGRRKAATRSK